MRPINWFLLFIGFLGFGLVVWKAGWIVAAGIFLMIWANNASRNRWRLKGMAR